MVGSVAGRPDVRWFRGNEGGCFDSPARRRFQHTIYIVCCAAGIDPRSGHRPQPRSGRAGFSWLIAVTSPPPARHENPARAFPPPRAGHPAPARTCDHPMPRHPHVSAAAPVPLAVGPDIAASTRRRRAAVMTTRRRARLTAVRAARWRATRLRRRGLRVRGERQAPGAGGAGHGDGSKEIATMHRQTPEGPGSPPDRASVATLARRLREKHDSRCNGRDV